MDKKRFQIKSPVKECEYFGEILGENLKVSRRIYLTKDKSVYEEDSYIFHGYSKLIENLHSYLKKKGEVELKKAVDDKELHQELGLFHYIPEREREESYKSKFATYMLILAAKELENRIGIDTNIKPIKLFYRPNKVEAEEILLRNGVEKELINRMFEVYNLEKPEDSRELSRILSITENLRREGFGEEDNPEIASSTISILPNKKSGRPIILTEEVEDGKVKARASLLLSDSPNIKLVRDFDVSIGCEEECFEIKIDENVYKLLSFELLKNGRLIYKAIPSTKTEVAINKITSNVFIANQGKKTIVVPPYYIKPKKLLKVLRKDLHSGGYVKGRQVILHGKHDKEKIKKIISRKILQI